MKSLSLCAWVVVFGRLVDAGSKFQIQIPKSLQRKDGYDHIEARFGYAPYGGTIQQKVYYAGGSLCDATNIDPTAGFPKRPNNIPWEPPFILMVDVHACGAIQQVRNGQQAGASAVLLADTKCMCFRPECRHENENDIDEDQDPQCHYSAPDMTDLSSSADVTIPSFYVYKEDGDRIKEKVMNNEHVVVSMSFQVPAPDDRVEYDLWIEPLSHQSIPMLSSFKEAAMALGRHARFTPHMHLFDGVRAGCPPVNGVTRCTNMCTNNGRYCLNDPDHKATEGNSGADLVEESLRRLCIWQHYGADDGIGVQWWDYMQYFLEMCESRPDQFANPFCFAKAMHRAGVDSSLIEQCIQDSGGLDGNIVNRLLNATLTEQYKKSITTTPALLVNDAPVRGHLDFGLAFRAICSGFPAGDQPDICNQCATCTATQECVATGGICESGYSNVKMEYQTKSLLSCGTFWSTLLMVAMSAMGVTTLYYRYNRERMRHQVKEIVAEYVPLHVADERGGFMMNRGWSFADSPSYATSEAEENGRGLVEM